jgi:radical SAM superfamily enzyme YgiQ (UPF0313 family)
MRYEGDVYRPPSEAESLIIQLTIGCAHNSCTFCTMYKNDKFRIRSLDEVFEDLEWVKRYYPYRFDRVFLADGDALIVKTPDLITLLDKIFELFPHVRRVTTYGAAKDVLQKSHEEMCQLRQHGLEMVYIGAESGSDKVLTDVCKGVTAAETVEACQKLKQAGIKTSMTLITGLGGKADSREHAIESAKLVSAAKPEYLGLLTLTMGASAPLTQKYRRGEFEILSPAEFLEEQKLFLEHVDSEGTVLRSNHVSNYVALAGTLNRDREEMIARLDDALARGKRWGYE